MKPTKEARTSLLDVEKAPSPTQDFHNIIDTKVQVGEHEGDHGHWRSRRAPDIFALCADRGALVCPRSVSLRKENGSGMWS